LEVHNRYREIGGEDFVVRSEADILSSAGHIVMRYERDNREIEKPAFSAAASLALQTIWSKQKLSRGFADRPRQETRRRAFS
jgi:hypothetical protein